MGTQKPAQKIPPLRERNVSIPKRSRVKAVFAGLPQCLGDSSCPKHAVAVLVAIGMATELIYGVALRVFYLPAYYSTPLLDLGKLTEYRVGAGWAYLAASVALFALYYTAFVVVLGSSGRARLIVVGGGVVYCLTLALVYPYGAADVFDYIFYGRMMAHYGVNPFVHTAADFGSDPFLPYVAWRFLPFTYGPIWAEVSAVLSKIGGDSLLVNLLLYKGAAIFFYLATLWLIDSILRRTARKYTAAGLLLFAWNPLVVTEIAANGHNDVLMMALILLAVRLMLARRASSRMLSIPVAAVSALSKFVTGMLVPLFLVAFCRGPDEPLKRVRQVVIGITLAFIVGIVSYAPFWQGAETLAVQRRDALFTASIPAVLKLVLEGNFGVHDARFVGLPFLLAFGVYIVFEAWRLPTSVTALIAASYRVTLVYLMFACLWFQPWYLIWLLSLAAIWPDLTAAHQSVLFSFTAMLNYFVFDYVWIWNAAHLDFLAIQVIAVAAIYTLPIGYAVWNVITSRQARQVVETYRA